MMLKFVFQQEKATYETTLLARHFIIKNKIYNEIFLIDNVVMDMCVAMATATDEAHTGTILDL